MECRICKQNRDLRLEVCYACAEAESIITEGLDMYDKGINGSNVPAQTSLEKLQLLIQKGWRC